MPRRLQIFRVGKQTAMDGTVIDFAADDLRKTAQSYDPAKLKAPLVVGHPALDAPAYGWVKSLSFTADGVLEADPEQVEARFATMVNEGRFPRISASFYLPGAPRNPAPGSYYLRHVGFLGAAAPAVQGLQPASFAEQEEGVVVVEFAEQAAAAAPAQPADPAARERELQAREEQLRQREVQFAARERTQELRRFVQPLVEAGRLLPRHLEPVLAFMGAVPEKSTIEFGADHKKLDALAWLKTFLQELPVQVEYCELAGPEQGAPAAGAEFAEPGIEVDAGRQALHRRALAYQQQHKDADYLTAVKAVQQAGGAR